jgi:hypothetical protein
MKDFIQTIECTVIEYKGRTYNIHAWNQNTFLKELNFTTH